MEDTQVSRDSTADSLAEIVRRCQNDDRVAKRELYEACQLDVYMLVCRMVGRQDAADLTQQVFLQVFRKLEQFRGKSRFRTWLYRLAMNESLQHIRKTRRIGVPLSEIEDQAPSKDRQLELRELVELALQAVDPQLRAVFMLKEAKGMSYREIADVCEIPEGTVASQLNRARRKLKDKLVELGWGV